ncbi:MAG: homoserine O-succinyltransferase [Arenicellales bacterium]|nr:homoserine O-succinyltransferase [Arenicellales bacterium]
MPLVAHNDLPTFRRLHEEGHDVLTQERALTQDIRELHIGILNMMPDAALEATERQFLRLLGSCNRIAQLYVHLFTMPGVERQDKARGHVERYYEDFDQLKMEGLDALVITGANPAQPVLEDEPFYENLMQVLEWARENICSTLCSCLATHAAVKRYHGIQRFKLPEKRWGVYSTQIVRPEHPLVLNTNTRFDAPQSHVYEVSRDQLEKSGLMVLADSAEACVHLATSPDGFRFIYFQGHPEYDKSSLLKEYKREVNRVWSGVRPDYPPFPKHYFSKEAASLLEEYKVKIITAKARSDPAPDFPEDALLPFLDNTWADTGKAMFNNWLGLVYQLTDRDRHIPYMANINPDDPLGLREHGRGSQLKGASRGILA